MPVTNASPKKNRTGSKERILAAAFEQFAEKGFDGATTRCIAERAGVNEVTLFRTFGSKKALFRQVADGMLILKNIEEDADFRVEGPAEDVLVHNASLALEILKENRHLFMILVGELWKHPELEDGMASKVLDQAVHFLAGQMRYLMDEKRLRRVDPYLAARLWMGVVQSHFLMHHLIGQGNTDPDAEDRMLREWADIFVNGAGLR